MTRCADTPGGVVTHRFLVMKLPTQQGRIVTGSWITKRQAAKLKFKSIDIIRMERSLLVDWEPEEETTSVSSHYFSLKNLGEEGPGREVFKFSLQIGQAFSLFYLPPPAGRSSYFTAQPAPAKQ